MLLNTRPPPVWFSDPEVKYLKKKTEEEAVKEEMDSDYRCVVCCVTGSGCDVRL